MACHGQLQVRRNRGLCRRRQQHTIDGTGIQTPARFQKVKRFAVDPSVATIKILAFDQLGCERLEGTKRFTLGPAVGTVEFAEGQQRWVGNMAFEIVHGWLRKVAKGSHCSCGVAVGVERVRYAAGYHRRMAMTDSFAS